jgi:hypothetical protein
VDEVRLFAAGFDVAAVAHRMPITGSPHVTSRFARLAANKHWYSLVISHEPPCSFIHTPSAVDVLDGVHLRHWFSLHKRICLAGVTPSLAGAVMDLDRFMELPCHIAEFLGQGSSLAPPGHPLHDKLASFDTDACFAARCIPTHLRS